jgi:osmotically inducible lipoprotein OsmB
MMEELMRSGFLITSLAVISIALSACGQSPGCRAVTGAGIGAAGGAVLGALGGNPLLGAAAGAAAGAAVGGLTTQNQINAGPAPCN